MKSLVGQDAIDFAEEHGLLLEKYGDPIEGHRKGLTVEEAEEVAEADPGLIYIIRPISIFEEIFEREHLPSICKEEGKYGAWCPDVPLRRETWNNWLDRLCKAEACNQAEADRGIPNRLESLYVNC